MDALYPAALVVAENTETSQRVVDVVFGALARALPGQIPSASCGTMSSVTLGGVRADGTPWTYYETIGGGSGAGPGWVGYAAVQCHMTNTLNTPAEAIEMQYPLRVEAFEVARGTAGAGRWRGGDGTVRRLRALAACEGTLLSDRRVGWPYGLQAGAAGASGADSVRSGEMAVIPAKSEFDLQAGDVLEVCTPGGGGWGS